MSCRYRTPSAPSVTVPSTSRTGCDSAARSAASQVRLVEQQDAGRFHNHGAAWCREAAAMSWATILSPRAFTAAWFFVSRATVSGCSRSTQSPWFLGLPRVVERDRKLSLKWMPARWRWVRPAEVNNRRTARAMGCRKQRRAVAETTETGIALVGA